MKKTIIILFILSFFVLCTRAQEFDPQPLQNEITALEQQIKEASTESKKYTGGLIKALIDSRVQILKHTKAMLEQRLKAGNYKTEINYTVDGQGYVPPAKKDEMLKNLESEALRMIQEMEKAQKEADQYSGGLIRVMKLSTVATHQQQLAMLDMKRCALIYDIPLFTFEEKGVAPAESPDLSPEESAAEIDSMFEIKLYGKMVFEADYSEHLGLNLRFINHTEKDIRAVQAILIFTDLFDVEILRTRLTVEQDIPAGEIAGSTSYSIELNKFKPEHNRLKTIKTKNLKMQAEIQSIIFKDGSTIKR